MFVALICLAGLSRADTAADLARIHLEAIGGKARIAALKSMRATGNVVVGGSQVRFAMTAARPNKVRVETDNGGRTLVQGTDGVEPPWEFDTGSWPPKYRSMADNVARVFAADAEFDDPLVAAASRGYSFDYAGEFDAEGRKLLRILVTRKLTDTFSVFLDPNTFFIVMRAEQRTTVAGRKIHVVTHFDDFRPVDGVLLPHRITVVTDGRLTQQTRIDRIEANPELKEGVFSRPKVTMPPVSKG
jgi:hypothetical protein